MRALIGAWAILAAFGCAAAVGDCPAMAGRCGPVTQLSVVTESNGPVTTFSGAATFDDGTFVFGCGGATAPDAGLTDGGSVRKGSCIENVLQLYGSGPVTLDLNSPAGGFNGIVTTVFDASGGGPSEDKCSGVARESCGVSTGSVTVR